MAANEMRLRPSARLQKYLGRELIADPNLAIIEFVKNAYDAGASEVVVDFEIRTFPAMLTISDNGIGMDEESFRTNWLRPGFSSKSTEYTGPPTHPAGSSPADALSHERSPAGEKGLGRLASGRLGDVMEVWTRPSSGHPWLHVTLNWLRFETMTEYMDEVDIPYDSASPVAPEFDSGTIIRISDLRQSWNGRIPGRPAPGRSRTRLGRLKQDLELLIRPYGGRSSEFSVNLQSDAYLSPDDIGEILASDGSQSADYTYKFFLGVDEADYVTVTAEITRSTAIVEEFGLKSFEKVPDLTINAKVARAEQRPDSLRCGIFEGTFFYTPPPKAKRAKEIDSAGVLLYRDGVLVEPYGMGDNDWVGVAARKASRQGHAAIQPATFSGFVTISRKNNPELEEMSNRLGLLDTAASDDFTGHVRAEFARFEERLYNEVVRPRWETQEEKASKAASRAEELARIRIRSLVHSMGQPMTAIGVEVLRLELIRKRGDIPDPVRLELRDIQSRIETHLNRMGAVTGKFADLHDPDFGSFSAADLVAQALGEVKDLADMYGVKVLADAISSAECIVPGALIVDSLKEVVTNAIESARQAGNSPEVNITTEATARVVRILVSDNGVGFKDGVPVDLTAVPSTSGRVPDGLATVDNALRLAGGRAYVSESTPSGATMVLELPRKNLR